MPLTLEEMATTPKGGLSLEQMATTPKIRRGPFSLEEMATTENPIRHERKVQEIMDILDELPAVVRAPLLTGMKLDVFRVGEFLMRHVAPLISKEYAEDTSLMYEAMRRYQSEMSFTNPEKYLGIGAEVGKTVVEFAGVGKLAKGAGTATKFALQSLLQAPTAEEEKQPLLTTLAGRAVGAGESYLTGAVVGAVGKAVPQTYLRAPALAAGFASLTGFRGGTPEQMLESAITIFGFEAWGLAEKGLHKQAAAKASKFNPELKDIAQDTIQKAIEEATEVTKGLTPEQSEVVKQYNREVSKWIDEGRIPERKPVRPDFEKPAEPTGIAPIEGRGGTELGKGIYFSTSKSQAESYAAGKGAIGLGTEKGGGQVIGGFVDKSAKLFNLNEPASPELFNELMQNPKFAKVWKDNWEVQNPTNNELWSAGQEARIGIQDILTKKGYQGALHRNYATEDQPLGSKDIAVWDKTILTNKSDGIPVFRGQQTTPKGMAGEVKPLETPFSPATETTKAERNKSRQAYLDTGVSKIPEVELEISKTLGKKVAAMAAKQEELIPTVGYERAIFASTEELRGPQASYVKKFDSYRKTQSPEVIDADFGEIYHNKNFSSLGKLHTAESYKKFIDGHYITLTDAARIEKQFGMSVSKHVPFSEKFWNVTAEIAGGVRTSLTTGDDSGVFRQGASLASGYPKEGAEFFKRSNIVLFNKEAAEKYDLEVENSPEYSKLKKAGLDLTKYGKEKIPVLEREERMVGARLLYKVPVIGEIVGASDRAFHQLNYLRFAIGQRVLLAAEAAGKPLTPAQIKALASAINDLSGRSKIPGKAAGAYGVMRAVASGLFAPRFALSRVKVPFYTLPKAIGKSVLEGEVQPELKVTARAISGHIALNLLVMGLIKAAWGDKAQVDPDLRSTDGGKIVIGNRHIDLWSGYLPPIRAIYQLATGQVKDASGKIYEADRKAIIERLFRSKTSPAVGLFLDAWTGRNYIGQKMLSPPTGKVGEVMTSAGIPRWVQGVSKELWNRAAPMVIQDTVDALILDGIPAAVTAFPLAFYGVGIQSYPRTTSMELKVVQNEIAQKTYGKKWDDLGPVSQKLLVKKNPELVELEFKKQIEYVEAGGVNYSFLPEARERSIAAGQSVLKMIPADFKKAIDTTGITVAMSRSFGDWKLSDKQYEKYQQYTAERLNLLWPKYSKINWGSMNLVKKDKVLREILDHAKAYAIKKVRIEASKEDKQSLKERAYDIPIVRISRKYL